MKHVRSVDDFKIRNPFRQGDKGYQYIEEKGQYREVTPIILRKREERKEKWPIQIDKEAKSFDLVSSILEHYEIRHSFYNNHKEYRIIYAYPVKQQRFDEYNLTISSQSEELFPVKNSKSMIVSSNNSYKYQDEGKIELDKKGELAKKWKKDNVIENNAISVILEGRKKENIDNKNIIKTKKVIKINKNKENNNEIKVENIQNKEHSIENEKNTLNENLKSKLNILSENPHKIYDINTVDYNKSITNTKSNIISNIKSKSIIRSPEIEEIYDNSPITIENNPQKITKFQKFTNFSSKMKKNKKFPKFCKSQNNIFSIDSSPISPKSSLDFLSIKSSKKTMPLFPSNLTTNTNVNTETLLKRSLIPTFHSKSIRSSCSSPFLDSNASTNDIRVNKSRVMDKDIKFDNCLNKYWNIRRNNEGDTSTRYYLNEHLIYPTSQIDYIKVENLKFLTTKLCQNSKINTYHKKEFLYK